MRFMFFFFYVRPLKSRIYGSHTQELYFGPRKLWLRELWNPGRVSYGRQLKCYFYASFDLLFFWGVGFFGTPIVLGLSLKEGFTGTVARARSKYRRTIIRIRSLFFLWNGINSSHAPYAP